MNEASLIKYWARMLDESEGLGRTSGRELLDEEKHPMHGPAWAARTGGVDEIADMRQKLDNGVVEFVFWKHGEDGQGDVERHAVGTTSEQVVPVAERRRLDPNYDENVASYERRRGFIVWFWDMEINEVRCFNTNRFDRIVNYVQTQQRAAPDIRRVGNIFIHRDVDAAAGQPLTDERIDQINDDLEQATLDRDFSVGNIENSETGIVQAYIDRSPDDQQPVLRIEINKRANDDDPPYELRINEMRRYIREHYGVDVRKATVDGVFEY